MGRHSAGWAREWAPCRHPRAKRDLDRRANRAKFRTGAVTQVAPVPQTQRSAETGAGEHSHFQVAKIQ